MQQALRLASTAGHSDEIPVGAVLVAGTKVLARTHNQTEQLNDPTAHAEILAITAACQALGSKYLVDCALYVSLEPCPMCAGALAWAQIGAIFYGAPDPRRGYSTISPHLLHPKTHVSSGHLAAQVSTMMTDFFKGLRG